MKNTLMKKLKHIPLSKQEKVIADTITKNLQKNAFLNGPQIAALCDVAPSSITRFAQKLGYTGFPDLKKELETLYRKTTTPHDVFREFLNGNGKKDVVDSTIEQDIQNIMNLRTQLDRKTLEMVIEKIDTAKKIIIASIGASETCVDIFYYYLDALGKDYIPLKGFGISKQIEILDIEPGDVVIAISFQKILREVRDVAQFAKARDATTIAITDSNFNALAHICDLVLIAPVTAAAFSLSQAAPVVMVNLIVNSLAALNKEKSLQILEKTKKEWEELPIFCD